MKFSSLLDGVEVLSTAGDAEITGIQYDSRKVHPGDCFIAIQGETTDGNLYISAAIQAGARALISDSTTHEFPSTVAWARVPHGRRAMARASANFYGKPAERLGIVGVTGTNGKTTTTFLIEKVLEIAGRKSALIGTIEYRIAGKVVPAPHTTPESLELNEFFAQAVRAGATDAVMEVSSHALHQERTFGIFYDVAVFTNLTQDHLDYHSNMESYFAAKQILFAGSGVAAPRVAIINADDEYGRQLIDFSRKQGSTVWTYGLGKADFYPENLDIAPNGSRFDMVTPAGKIAIFTPLVGKVNVYNVLAAAAAAHARDCTLKQIASAVLDLRFVPGRFQRIDCGQPFTVVVDYAHTDDALRNLTSVAREFVAKSGVAHARVITVFGCGGDRDRDKRPRMARAAAQNSDFIVLTSDNPRSEDPLLIIHDALAGIRDLRSDYTLEPDRRRAISLAIRLAKPGDIVLIAGKGHEKTQTTRDGVFTFDDVEVARQALIAVGYPANSQRRTVSGPQAIP